MVELKQALMDSNEDCLSVQLTDYGILSVSGEDTDSFLQGQLTCDVRKLDQEDWLYGAHCDPTGKAFSNFWLFRHDNAALFVMHKSALEGSLTQLKKYGVFSKVDIEDVSTDWQVAGFIGNKAKDALPADSLTLHVGQQPDQLMLTLRNQV